MLLNSYKLKWKVYFFATEEQKVHYAPINSAWLVQIPSPRGKKAVQMPHQLLLNYLSSRQISSSIKHLTRLSERDMP